MNGQKVLIGMSGGVDSSVAALLMKEQGYTCIGATMRLFDNEALGLEQGSTCCSLDDVEDARSVARKMGIPHYVFNFTREFQALVMDKFSNSYAAGLTPSPCIDCNRYLKFEKLLQRATELGCDYVVSGHYARIRRDEETGRYLLCKAADRAKDQTYFLYPLNQYQMSHIQFPLGELTKPQVREIAAANGFITARKHDSQDICFVPNGDYVEFLRRYTGKEFESGDFLDENGRVVGHHHGAIGYTLGQRRGLGLAMGEPVYVCGKDMVRNTVTVGPNASLYSSGLLANDWTWFPFPELTEPMQVTVKIRHTQFEQPATLTPMADGFARVDFDQPMRAVTPGQAVVAYQGEIVVGGGTITQAIP